jgi:hypothetical protein
LQVLPVHVGKQLQIKLVKPSIQIPLIHGFEAQAFGVTKILLKYSRTKQSKKRNIPLQLVNEIISPAHRHIYP